MRDTLPLNASCSGTDTDLIKHHVREVPASAIVSHGNGAADAFLFLEYSQYFFKNRIIYISQRSDSFLYPRGDTPIFSAKAAEKVDSSE